MIKHLRRMPTTTDHPPISIATRSPAQYQRVQRLLRKTRAVCQLQDSDRRVTAADALETVLAAFLTREQK